MFIGCWRDRLELSMFLRGIHCGWSCLRAFKFHFAIGLEMIVKKWSDRLQRWDHRKWRIWSNKMAATETFFNKKSHKIKKNKEDCSKYKKLSFCIRGYITEQLKRYFVVLKCVVSDCICLYLLFLPAHY